MYCQLRPGLEARPSVLVLSQPTYSCATCMPQENFTRPTSQAVVQAQSKQHLIKCQNCGPTAANCYTYTAQACSCSKEPD